MLRRAARRLGTPLSYKQLACLRSVPFLTRILACCDGRIDGLAIGWIALPGNLVVVAALLCSKDWPSQVTRQWRSQLRNLAIVLGH